MGLGAGTMIGPNVRLAHLLGRGGMGSVWVADHLTLNVQVAVKFMANDIAADRQAMTRFSGEASAAASLKSPHVVQVFDHGVTDDGLPYIVMELLDGEDLGRYLQRVRTMPAREVAVLVDQVCRALGRAHASGIVHRDIKPENIFLVSAHEDEMFVKLLDFGIAKRYGEDGLSAYSANYVIGTPAFMSPEQLMANAPVDAQADLWSLAVVAYSALTGVLPFEGESMAATIGAIQDTRFTVPGAFNRELSALDPFFTRAFAREPSARFGSAREFAAEFAACVGYARSSLSTSGAEGVTGVVQLDPSDVHEIGNATLLAGEITGPRRSRSRKLPVLLGALGLSAAAGGAYWITRANDPAHMPPVVVMDDTSARAAAATRPEPPIPPKGVSVYRAEFDAGTGQSANLAARNVAKKRTKELPKDPEDTEQSKIATPPSAARPAPPTKVRKDRGF